MMKRSTLKLVFPNSCQIAIKPSSQVMLYNLLRLKFLGTLHWKKRWSVCGIYKVISYFVNVNEKFTIKFSVKLTKFYSRLYL